MISFSRFYKNLGVIKNQHFVNPKLIISETLKFPKNTLIMYHGIPDINYYPDMYTNIYSNAKKLTLYNVDTYIEPIGKLRKSSLKITQLTREVKSKYPKINIIYSLGKLLLTPSTSLVVMNYGFLNKIYKYTPDKDMHYNIHYNTIKTLAHHVNENLLSGRIKYINIDMPDFLHRPEDYEKALKYRPNRLTKIFMTFEELTIFQLYKWLTPEYRSSSPFNIIDKDLYHEVVFIFNYGHKSTIIRADYLLSLVSEYNMDTPIRGYKGIKARRLFLLYLFKSLINVGKPMDELDKRPDIYDKISVKDNDIDNILDNMDIEIEEHKNSVNKDTSDDVYNKIIDDINNVKPKDELIKDNKEPKELGIEYLNELLEHNIIDEKEYKKRLDELSDKEIEKLDKETKVTQEDLVLDKKIMNIPDSNTILDKGMLQDPIKAFDKQYIEKIYKKDTVQSILSFRSSGHAIKNVSIKEVEDPLGDTIEYEFEIKAIGQSRYNKIKVVLPKINEDGTFKVAGNTYIMRKQKTDVPIKKITATRVALSSYKGKSFIEKATYSKDDIGVALNRQFVNRAKNGDIKLLVSGTQNIIAVKLPITYSWLGRTIKSFTYKGIRFVFNYKLRLKYQDNVEKIEKGKYVYIGKKGNTSYLLDFNNKIIEYKDGKYIELEDIFTFLDIDVSKLPVEYAVLYTKGIKVPIGILLTYYFGLKKLLKMTGVKFKVIKSDDKYKLESNEYKLTFRDFHIILDKNDIENSLIFGGLKSINKYLVAMDMELLNTRDGVVSICKTLNYAKEVLIEFDMLDRLFVDPMTKQVLESMKEPTTWRGLVFRSIELLKDDYVIDQKHISGITIKGYERINGILYNKLATVISQYEAKKNRYNAKLTMSPYEIMTTMMNDSTVGLQDDLNPITVLKQREEITSLGEFGRNKDTMSKSTRGIHESEIGIISETSKDSSDVGITNFLSANPNLANARGVTFPVEGDEVEFSKVLSTSALLAPFSIHDDSKRVNFITIQNSHVIPVNTQSIIPIRTGEELVISNRVSDKYVVSAKDDGIVKDKTKDTLVVKYKNGDTETVKLKVWNSKEESGSTYIHEMVSYLKKGDKFKFGDTLAYDKLFFGRDIFNPNRVVLKMGVIMRTMYVESQDTHEDSMGLSISAAKKLQAKLGKIKPIKVKYTDEIISPLFIGEKVKYDTDLLKIVDNSGNDYNDPGYQLDDKSVEILDYIKTKSPSSEAKGVIKDIKVYYNCELKDMTKSLRSFINKVDKYRIESLGEKHTGRVTSGFSMNGKPLEEGEIIIKYYIDTDLDMTLGDKAVLANQLKCTLGETFSDDTVSEDGQPIECKFSRRATSARIVDSPDTIGTTITLLKDMTENVFKMAGI